MSLGFFLTASLFSLLGYGLCYIIMASKRRDEDGVRVSLEKAP